MSQTIRILIADDHPVVRDGLRAILGTQADFQVVGEAASGNETLQDANRLQPDVILLDLEMPDGDGVETLQHLQAARHPARVLVFTVFDTDERILGAVRAGARGYLLKGAPREEIFRAIRIVHAGGSLLEPLVASRLLQQIHTDQPLLTARQLDVLRLMTRGLQNKEIALALQISERTVKFHVTALLQKLGAGNRTEAVTIAAQRGLVNLG